MRIIVNTVVYNEESNIATCLTNLRRIRDVWAVEILDGAWKVKDLENPVNSTDKTERVIEAWKKTTSVPFEVNYTKSEKTWETESEKRNFLLKKTEEKYGDCWVLVLDADESIKFPNGRSGIYLNKKIEDKKHCGVIKAYGYNSSHSLPSIRLIPTKNGVHYHTELAMILHNDKCQVLMDYNPTRIWQSTETFNLDDFFIVNYWGLRNGERQIEKYQYYKQQTEQDFGVKCKWSK